MQIGDNMRLIINADDLGFSKSINEGILHGIKNGAITSSTILMNQKYTNHAIKIIKENDLKCIGIHLNVTKGVPLSNDVPSLINEDGKMKGFNRNDFEGTYEDVYKEMKMQIEKYISYGLKPDHLDHHHDLQYFPICIEAFVNIAKEYNLPIRAIGNETMAAADLKKVKYPDVFTEEFFRENVSFITLQKIIGEYKNKDISIDLMTHSGYVDEETPSLTGYYIERPLELELLIKAKKEGLFDDIEMISYGEL